VSWPRVRELAASLVAKSEGGLTEAQAVVRVLEERPELYTDAEREREARVAARRR